MDRTRDSLEQSQQIEDNETIQEEVGNYFILAMHMAVHTSGFCCMFVLDSVGREDEINAGSILCKGKCRWRQSLDGEGTKAKLKSYCSFLAAILM